MLVITIRETEIKNSDQQLFVVSKIYWFFSMAKKLFNSLNGGSFYFFYLKILQLNSYKNAKQKKIVGFDLTQGKALNSFSY